ncbi:histidinol dehydrogenase [Pedobacter sp. HMF7647]|uniref:Histidinol dehydrogenase n=1 Tax=Hufsiella arboris TaxID=2695275 RepID=A0A7K1YDD7_9SPHI|nr:histidinol dehydrogenase [Hufsiella arboris]MXV52607.1 histidinol dehydrogenase [Hufsiella arboris]
MLKQYNYSELSQEQIAGLIERNNDSNNDIRGRVEQIIDKVRQGGDQALKQFARDFDKVELQRLYIGSSELAALVETLDDQYKSAIRIAFDNIHKFHQPQLKTKEKTIETMPGVNCWRESRAIERVGLYIPGGSAVLPSTLLMLGIPAKIAGCKEIIVCSPPQKDGSVNAAIAFVCTLLDIDKIYLAGGAQAVAAMAYGTESIPKVDKIFGPGNQYVTMAKTILQGSAQVAIDMPAGPSEVLIIADEAANPAFVAADMLAQAEHGADSQAVLVSLNESLVAKVQTELKNQLEQLPRKEVTALAIDKSFAIIANDLTEAMQFSNSYAPEHLILQTDSWQELVPRIINAGSVFLGHLTPESAGDYASGTNHTLPTSAYARSYSGVSVDSFVKKITFQNITKEGVQNIGETVERLAELEGLQAHKNAMSLRIWQTNINS